MANVGFDAVHYEARGGHFEGKSAVGDADQFLCTATSQIGLGSRARLNGCLNYLEQPSND
jgi:hypothetical protein